MSYYHFTSSLNCEGWRFLIQIHLDFLYLFLLKQVIGIAALSLKLSLFTVLIKIKDALSEMWSSLILVANQYN